MNDKDALLKDYRELLTSLAWAKGKEPHPAKIARITAALEDGGWIKCSERLAQPDAKRILVIRGQKDKVVAIYREDDVDILRTEMKKEDLLSVWMKEKNHV